MKTKLNTKILAALLAVLLFLSCCPMFSFAELFPEDFHISYEGKKAAQIDIYIHEKKTVTAENLPEGSTYQWQIRIPGTDTWVDIQGQTGQELGISYALVGSLMVNGSAAVRCAAVGGETVCTDMLKVTVTEEPEEIPMEETEATEATAAPTEEAAEETSAPTEPETVPDVTEETTEAETVPETTIPSEEETIPETTAPTQEQETIAPTEEAVPETTVATESEAVPETTESVNESTAPREDAESAAATEAAEENITAPTEEAAATEKPEAAEEPSAPAKEETVPAEARLAAEPPEETVPQTEPAPPMLFTVNRSISEEDSADNGDIMLLAEGEEAVPEFVTVKIQYMRYDYIKNAEGNMVLTDNGQAFNPYIATLLKGSSLNTEVVFPTMVGYDTFVNDSEKSDVSLPISLTDIQNDVTYVVKYMPAQVDYTVRYYFQNIYDDNYVENTDIAAAKYAQGATGSAPDNALVQAVFPGFTSLYYEPELIAADGSTEFEVFYERNYYLMEFDCNEGYGTDTLYVRYGTYISVPQPVRTGYLFDGWDLVKSENPDSPVSSGDDVADTIPLEMPRYNSAYKAKWRTTGTKYTVIYWRENANDNAYSYWGSEEFPATSATTVSGSDNVPKSVSEVLIDGDLVDESVYFTYNDALTDKNILVKGDGTTLVNVYYDRKDYELRFFYARRAKSGTGNIYISDYTRTGYNRNSTNESAISGSGWGSTGAPTWKSSGVTTEPVINAPNLTKSSIELGSNRYYYLSFRAKYGADIENLWPANVIGSLKDNVWNFGSWATENGSEYRGDNSSNANIVGPYPILSHLLIVNPNNDIAHNFVAWWGQEGRSASQNDNVAPHTYHIYFEVLPSERDDENVVEYNGKYYKKNRDIVFAAAHKTSTPTRVDPFEYAGYSVAGMGENDDPDNSANCLNEEPGHEHYCNTYYYSRNLYTVSFYNHNAVSNENGTTFPTVELPFGESIQKALPSTAVAPDYEPPYPDGIEPGAYTFEKWYTTSQFLSTTNVDWNSMHVPVGDVTLYAKWVPVTHNVYFHSLYTDIGTTNYWYPKDENGTEIHIQYPIEVEHGALLGTTYNYLPDRSGYTFIGWFYMDADNKKRFAPDSMEIKEDLHLFAEWQSGIDTQYEINYVLGESVTIDGTPYPINTPIAEPTAGHSTAGKTKTFTAKGMGELYEKFRNNMFPTVSSHSVLMDEDKAKNSFNFTYVYDEEVYYKVRYVDYVEGTELIPAKVKLSPNAIVTEKFMPIQGYVPMNFYIRKALISDGDNTSTDDVEQENVITFYYTQDDKHGLYAIEYYQETAVAGEYAKYESIVGSADLFDDKDNPTVINVGDEFKIRSYNGFTYYGYKIITYDTAGNPSTTDSIQTSGDLQGTLTYAGLTIQLYYTRNQYPYTIEYREQGTEKLLKQVSDNSAEYQNKFGTEVSHTAVETLTVGSTPYTYYIPHSTEDDRTKSITIRSFQAGEDNPNELIFYYLPKTVEVLYRVAYRNTNLKDLCHVSMAGEIATTVAGLLGSLAMPGEGFRFVGWYLDEEGTLPVNADWVTTEGGYQKLKPQALDTSMDQVSYYALFEPIDLTVTYDTAGGDPISPQTSHIGETFPLPSATRDGYALVSWWLDSDGDGTVDEGEEYKAGTTFTMPGRDVTFVAQWIDYRLADNVKVYVGINMSYYKNGDNLYYNIPDGEPAIINLSGIRIHNHKQTNGTYHWEIDFTDWDDWLDGVPLDFIKPEIMNPGVLQKNPNQDVWGVYDEDGSDTKALLYFGERNEYTGANGIVEAWLHDIDTLAQKYPSNIDWDALKKMKASDFEVIPYVIKYHRRNTYGEYAWFIDMVIVPVQRYKITYQLNLAPGYTDTAPKDGYEYGQGFIANIANFHDVARGDNPNSIAKFLGWHYDKNGNGKVDAGELLAGGSKLTMPAAHVTLTAVWDYPLIISQTGIADSAIYEVVDDYDNVILTVALTGEEQVAVYQLPAGDYTVREKTDWTWKYDSDGSHEVTVTGNGEKTVKFTYTGTTPDWLNGETHKENNFVP